jgi:bidirectional [NiFe] hydrogenase diaphorase subunit
VNPVAQPPAPPDAREPRREALDAAMRRHRLRGDALIEVLHAAQELYGWLPPEVLAHVARTLRLPPSRVQGVASFYHLFHLTPPARHVCTVCTGTACHVRGARAIVEAVTAATGLAPGESAADGSLAIARVRCVGACGVAPVVLYDGAVEGRQEPGSAAARVSRWGAP